MDVFTWCNSDNNFISVEWISMIVFTREIVLLQSVSHPMNGLQSNSCPLADIHSKILDAPSPGVQILSISCSFWEHLAKSYVGVPPGGLAPPPQGNPGSATAVDS